MPVDLPSGYHASAADEACGATAVAWLDGTGHEWTVMAPARLFADAQLIDVARAVRSLQPFWCLPLFSWCA